MVALVGRPPLAAGLLPFLAGVLGCGPVMAREEGHRTDAAQQRAHDRAVRRGESTYVDPATGFSVFTAKALRAKGSCCGSGCRHCPYTPEEQRRAGRPPE